MSLMSCYVAIAGKQRAGFDSQLAIPLGSIPSPSVSYLQLGPFRVHFYALCILAGMAGVLVAGFSPFGRRRVVPEACFDVAMWAIRGGN